MNCKYLHGSKGFDLYLQRLACSERKLPLHPSTRPAVPPCCKCLRQGIINTIGRTMCRHHGGLVLSPKAEHSACREPLMGASPHHSSMGLLWVWPFLFTFYHPINLFCVAFWSFNSVLLAQTFPDCVKGSCVVPRQVASDGEKLTRCKEPAQGLALLHLTLLQLLFR